jgi:hypothetical protein
MQSRPDPWLPSLMTPCVGSATSIAPGSQPFQGHLISSIRGPNVWNRACERPSQNWPQRTQRAQRTEEGAEDGGNPKILTSVSSVSSVSSVPSVFVSVYFETASHACGSKPLRCLERSG